MIRIGIVGCGRILNAHLQGYLALRRAGVDSFRITALATRNRDDALMFATRGQGPTPRAPTTPPSSGDPLGAPHTYLSDFQPDVQPKIYTDYRQMLEEDAVDAVNDFTSLSMHHRVGLDSLAAGKHLLTQKPLAVSVKAGRALVSQAARRGLVMGVVEVVRYDRFNRALHWAVGTGLIGEPQLAVVGSLGGLWSPDRIVAGTPWRHQKLLGGGGATIDLGVHFFHQLRYVLGEVAWVNATTRTLEPVRTERDAGGAVIRSIRSEVDDTYLATVGFENRAIAQMLWSWGCHGEPLKIPGTPAFYGSKGAIRGTRLLRDGEPASDLVSRFEESLTPAGREKLYPLGLTDLFAIQQLDWLRAIEEKSARAADRAGPDRGGPDRAGPDRAGPDRGGPDPRGPETSGEECLRDLACAFAMVESSAVGRQVTLHQVLSGAVNGYQAEIDKHYGL